MKLEVVDPRVPFLIRVASVADVKGHQLKIVFDGWPDELASWMDDDSPDIHPVGWCLKTGHPLEPPLTAEELSVRGSCGVGGCRGLGSVRGGPHKQHNAASTCPYRRRAARPDRLEPGARLTQPRQRFHSKSAKSVHTSTPTSDSTKDKDSSVRGRPPKHKRVEEVKNADDVVSEDESESSGGGKRWRGSEGSAPGDGDDARDDGDRHEDTQAERDDGDTRDIEVSGDAPEQRPMPRAHLQRHIDELDLPTDPTAWTEKEVAALVGRLGGAGAGAAALTARLRGSELVMASRDELVSCLRLRLGPAVKVYAAVCLLRAQRPAAARS